MASKTISLDSRAYDHLMGARRHPRESLSQVILRARWDDATITGQALLERSRAKGPTFDSETIDRLEEAQELDAPPVDKWDSL